MSWFKVGEIYIFAVKGKKEKFKAQNIGDVLATHAAIWVKINIY